MNKLNFQKRYKSVAKQKNSYKLRVNKVRCSTSCFLTNEELPVVNPPNLLKFTTEKIITKQKYKTQIQIVSMSKLKLE